MSETTEQPHNQDKLDRMVQDFTSHRHEMRNLIQNFNIHRTESAIANKQVDDIHGNIKIAQGAFQNFTSIPKDLADIRSSLLDKATNRTGIPASIVMQMFLLYTIAIAIPIWLPIIIGTNTTLNINRDGVGIVSQQDHQQPR